MNLCEAFAIIRFISPFPCWKCLLAHDCGNFPNLCFKLYYLVLREMGRHPGALVVHHAVEFEGEDAGLVGWSSAEIKTQMSNGNTIYFLYLLCCWVRLLTCLWCRSALRLADLQQEILALAPAASGSLLLNKHIKYFADVNNKHIT